MTSQEMQKLYENAMGQAHQITQIFMKEKGAPMPVENALIVFFTAHISKMQVEMAHLRTEINALTKEWK